MLPRITHAGMVMANVYEIDIPKQQQAIIDDRRIASSEIAENKKSNAEIEGVKRYLGLK